MEFLVTAGDLYESAVDAGDSPRDNGHTGRPGKVLGRSYDSKNEPRFNLRLPDFSVQKIKTPVCAINILFPKDS
jgi:hypothetical protein